jgi:HEAT repeat protein
MLKRVRYAIVALLVVATTARAADLARAKKFLEIDDYVSSIVELHKIIQADPTHAEARYLMAKAFVASPVDIQMPGPVTVGRSNEQRALLQLGVLAKLGKDGEKYLIEAVRTGDRKLTPPAIRAAGNGKMKAIVPALLELVKKPETDTHLLNICATALGNIGGEKAAEAIKAAMKSTKQEDLRRQLATQFVRCLDKKKLVELAKTETDNVILHQLCYNAGASPEIKIALVKRGNINVQYRLASLQALATLDPNAYRDLLPVLMDDASPKVRWAAIQAAAARTPDKAIQPLIALLSNKALGASALGQLRTMKAAEAVEPLVNILEDLSDAKKRANWSLHRPTVIDTIVHIGAKGDLLARAVRAAFLPDPAQTGHRTGDPTYYSFAFSNARHVLQRLPKSDYKAALLELTGDKDPKMRSTVIMAARPVDAGTAIEVGTRLLNDKDKAVLRNAEQLIISHAYSGGLKLEQLLPLLSCSSEQIVQRVAARIAAKPHKAAVEPMLALLKAKGTSSSTCSYAVQFFTKMPDKRAEAPLLDMMFGRRPNMSSQYMAQALKKCSPDLPAVARKLALATATGSSSVRSQCQYALRQICDLTIITKLMDDKDLVVRRAAADMLSQLRGKAPVELRLKMLKDDDEKIRSRALGHYDNLDAKDQVRLAKAGIEDKSDNVRRTASYIFSSLHLRGALKTGDILPLLKSKNTSTVKSAVGMLSKSPDKAAADAMLAVLKDRKLAGPVSSNLARYFSMVKDERAVNGLADMMLTARNSASLVRAIKNCTDDTSGAALRIAEGLVSKNSQTRYRAAYALKALGDKTVLVELRAARARAKLTSEQRALDSTIHELTQ